MEMCQSHLETTLNSSQQSYSNDQFVVFRKDISSYYVNQEARDALAGSMTAATVPATARQSPVGINASGRRFSALNQWKSSLNFRRAHRTRIPGPQNIRNEPHNAPRYWTTLMKFAQCNATVKRINCRKIDIPISHILATAILPPIIGSFICRSSLSGMLRGTPRHLLTMERNVFRIANI